MMHLKLSCPALSLLPVILVIAGLAGCASEFKYNATTSDGQKMTFRMINGAPEHATEAGLRTDTPKLDPNPKDKTLVYLLRLFVEKGEAAPRHVKVEDVSDETSYLLMEDAHPELKNGQWRGVSRVFKPEDPEMRWLSYLDLSFRVYRFTVVLADGRTVVLHEGVMIPAFGKTMLRRMLGEKE